MKTNQEKLLATLERMGACNASREWVKDKNIRTLRQAWQRCPKGDWLDWLAEKLAGYGYGSGRFDKRLNKAYDVLLEMERKHYFRADGIQKAERAQAAYIRRVIPFKLLEPLIRKAQQ